MTLTECIVEDAALTWFGELGYAVGHGPHFAPGEPANEGVRAPGFVVSCEISELEQKRRKRTEMVPF